MTITDNMKGGSYVKIMIFLVIVNSLRMTTNYLRLDWEVFRCVKHKLNTKLRVTVEGTR